MIQTTPLRKVLSSQKPFKIRLFLSVFVVLCLGKSVILTSYAAESTVDLVNRANAAAEKQEYPVAISLYEQARKKSPTEAALKKNLAIIYANYGVTLHEQKKDTEALAELEKGLALTQPGSREHRNIQQAKAGIYFAQAVELKNGDENPTPEAFAKMKILLNQAMELDPNETAFKKSMAGVYAEEAYFQAQQENFDKARQLLETSLTFDPQNKTLHQSLANVYLGLARQDVPYQKEWVDKALAMDNSPKVQQVGQQLLLHANVGTTAKSGEDSGSFARMPGEVKTVAPKNLTKLSVAEMVSDMEAQLQIQSPKGASLPERLDAVETQALGKPQSGPLAIRAKTLYTNLMGTAPAGATQSTENVTQSPPSNDTDNYLSSIFKVTDGKIIRWGKFPLRIYFEPSPKNELYKPEYKQAALDGFNTWKDLTHGFVNYVEVKNQSAADITVMWTAQYQDRFVNPESTTELYKNYKAPKRSHLMTAVQMASMFTPGYFSFAPQAVNAAMQYKMAKKMQVLSDESKIQLGLSTTQSMPPESAKILVQNMAAKEFGHALGLKGNSPQAGDLLYPELRSDVVQQPSSRDLATLREIYDRQPNIVLNIH
jgi:predicted Zn-dependent protease/tetratricopeptide (TPR) repeat protein